MCSRNLRARIPLDKMTKDLIGILNKVKEKISDNSDMVWTNYASAKAFREELQGYIDELEENNISSLETLQHLFLPTATLQEHSISNGWSDEYMKLSDEFDQLYSAMKKHG